MSARRLLVVAVALVAFTWAVRAATRDDPLPVAAPIVVSRAYVERADTVRRNQTLSELFANHNIAGADLLGMLEVAEGLEPRRVAPGQVFRFSYAIGEERPASVLVRVSADAILELRRDQGGAWESVTHAVTWTVHTEQLSGDIRVSLDAAVHRLIPDSLLPIGQRQRLVWSLADGVFGWTIDFTRDTYEGDRIELLYERLVSSLGEVRFGRVLGASIESRGTPQRAYVLADPGGGNAYYDESGRSLRRAFKMYPVEFRRISSGFNRARLHPVLRTSRPHLGVDYAAATGTPIVATGDGTVVRAGRWGGYGNVVVIRHARDIETRYAHMSRIARGIRPGVRVQQDQIIGQVGMTGLANGPHVHYEFLKNGRQQNPRTIDYGDGEPVPSRRRAEFEAVRAEYDRYLSPQAQRTQVD